MGGGEIITRPSDLTIHQNRNSVGVCKKCEGIAGIFKETLPFVPHYNSRDLELSANDGCLCCKLIHAVAGKLSDCVLMRKPYLRRDVESGPPCSEFNIESDNRLLYVYPTTANFGRDWGYRFELCKPHGWKEPMSLLGSRQEHGYPRVISESSTSKESWTLLTHWVTNCYQNHPKCHQIPSLLPTRIIDVSGNSPTLVVGGGKYEKYCILSHCWGGIPPLTTTRATLSERCMGMPMESLPRTFQDAVTVTQKLGITYLWIDSLCILQDDKEDWTFEAGRMHDYYNKSYLTISALDSPDSKCGLFTRQSQTPQPVLLSEDLQTSIRRPLSEPQDWQHQDLFGQAPLNQRAWTLQERLLSTRVIHYCKQELLWECLTCSAKESSTKESTSVSDQGCNMRKEGENFKRFLFCLDTSPQSRILAITFWHSLLGLYTKRSLTYHSDKLPAICGLGSLIQSITGMTYISGLWKEYPKGLLWSASVHDNRFASPIWPNDKMTRVNMMDGSTYKQPSWSWASMDVPVNRVFALYYDSVSTINEDINGISILSHGVSKLSSATGKIMSLEHIVLRAPTTDVQGMDGRRDLGKLTPVIHYAEDTKDSGPCYVSLDTYLHDHDKHLKNMMESGTVVKLAWLTYQYGLALELISETRLSHQKWRRIGLVREFSGIIREHEPLLKVLRWEELTIV